MARSSGAKQTGPARGRTLAAAVMLAAWYCLAASLSLVPPAAAAPQQAPNSRVVLDLPAGYVPSPLFSGFQNEELGVSYVILEMPLKAYDEIAAGFKTAELAKRGLTDVEAGTLQRSDAYTYMRARQTSPAGAFAKFFVLFKTADQSVLVSVSAPLQAVEAGTIDRGDIERVLAGATTASRSAARDLYRLGYLGPFREAGTFVGTGKLFTLDGRMEPERKGEVRSALVVAPSIDKRPLGDTEALAKSLLASLSGYRDVKLGLPTRLALAGAEAIELEATALDTSEGHPVRLYQVVVPGRDGGYFRIVGIATQAEATQLVPEFRKIAAAFQITG